MNSIEITAPAKVNLFLKILNKRKDGYHNILTLFERISLADVITLTKRPSGIVVTSDKFITHNPKENLVYKAAELILEKGKIASGVKIHIKKNIPIAAGLGGGSSDAASALIGLNKLFNIGLTKKELAALARRLGADVSFFILDTPFAIGRGRGDKLGKAHIKVRLWHLIINPAFKSATKDIYEAYDKRRLILRRSSGSSLEHLSKGLTTKDKDVKINRSLTDSLDPESLEDMLYNDLEEIAIEKKNVLGNIIERLAYHLGRKAIVSGSGPSVFCLHRTGKEGEAAKDKLFRSVPASQRKGWQVFIARTLD